MARHFAVVGDPIAHSLSPKIHSAAYKFLGLNWIYEARQIASGKLANFVSESPFFDGLSVTMPLKFEAFNISSSVDEDAEATGVVNTLLKTDDKILGFNTDVFGIIQAVREVEATSIAILGSGATASSAIRAMLASRPNSRIVCYARNPEALLNLSTRYKEKLETKSLDQYAGSESLTINTIPGFQVGEYQVLMNASYSKQELYANEIDGIEMLLWQALAQIRIFVNGIPSQPLEDEVGVLKAMRGSLIDT